MRGKQGNIRQGLKIDGVRASKITENIPSDLAIVIAPLRTLKVTGPFVLTKNLLWFKTLILFYAEHKWD